MSKITFLNDTQSSYTEREDYFSLRVVYDPSIGNNRFIGFYYHDTDLLEFTVNRQTDLVKEMQIVISNHYEVINENRPIPMASGAGSICLSHPQHNDCDTFAMKIYNNCFEIIISSKPTEKYFSMGQILFGFDNEENLVSLIVTDVSEADINHAITELQTG